MTQSLRHWSTPPQHCSLEAAEIHVWRATLDADLARVDRLAQTLSQDEQARAARFHFERDRRRFVVARGVLRTLLGNYLELPPAALRFVYNEYGKPALAPHHDRAPQFNLAHSGDWALFAFVYGAEIGVDLEAIRTGFDFTPLAEQFFSPQERAELHTMPAHLQSAAFFHCWTRKEAYIKARGQGLSLPLTSFSVTLRPDEPPRIKDANDGTEVAQPWTLYDLAPGNGYAGALAVQGAGWSLRCWQWSMARD
ncbi:MAG: 4'-phosphopantetheinyl transferase superfamily protein [Caldilineaceae bacterium]|nr:4'-phosphopantetheinyl transferase superfamily protein [Caldilineaceae bacterium]